MSSDELEIVEARERFFGVEGSLEGWTAGKTKMKLPFSSE
jgi:hypothetical protein